MLTLFLAGIGFAIIVLVIIYLALRNREDAPGAVTTPDRSTYTLEELQQMRRKREAEGARRVNTQHEAHERTKHGMGALPPPEFAHEIGMTAAEIVESRRRKAQTEATKSATQSPGSDPLIGQIDLFPTPSPSPSSVSYIEPTTHHHADPAPAPAPSHHSTHHDTWSGYGGGGDFGGSGASDSWGSSSSSSHSSSDSSSSSGSDSGGGGGGGGE
jgi:hypothetical protein